HARDGRPGAVRPRPRAPQQTVHLFHPGHIPRRKTAISRRDGSGGGRLHRQAGRPGRAARPAHRRRAHPGPAHGAAAARRAAPDLLLLQAHPERPRRVEVARGLHRGALRHPVQSQHLPGLLHEIRRAAARPASGRDMSLDRKIEIGFAIAVVIILAVGAAALRSTAATVESARWVAHTLEVRGELEATFADLIYAETAVRGYVITGDTTYLAPYDSALSSLGGLQAIQTRFRQVLASNTAVIYANTVSGATFAPSWVSENVTRITGYGIDEPLRPTWWLDNLHPDDRERVLAEMPALFVNDQLTTE